MASDAPSAWINPTDDLVATDSYRACSSWIGWRLIRNLRWLAEAAWPTRKFTGAAARVVSAHVHGSEDTSEPVLRSPVVDVFNIGSYTAFAKSVSTSDWIEMARARCWIGHVNSVQCELSFSNAPVSGESTLWKVELRPWNDSAAAGAVEHYIAETSGSAGYPIGARWHTVYGQLDGAGASVSSCSVDRPGGLHEVRLYAKTSGSNPIETGLFAWHVWEEA